VTVGFGTAPCAAAESATRKPSANEKIQCHIVPQTGRWRSRFNFSAGRYRIYPGLRGSPPVN
jgi:hypothetical protein